MRSCVLLLQEMMAAAAVRTKLLENATDLLENVSDLLLAAVRSLPPTLVYLQVGCPSFHLNVSGKAQMLLKNYLLCVCISSTVDTQVRDVMLSPATINRLLSHCLVACYFQAGRSVLR